MTENKRFMLDDAGEVIDLQTAKFIEYGEEILECLNNLHEEKEEIRYYHKRQVDYNIEYKQRVKDVLQKYCDKYYKRAILLKQPNGDVTEVLHTIAKELGVDLE